MIVPSSSLSDIICFLGAIVRKSTSVVLNCFFNFLVVVVPKVLSHVAPDGFAELGIFNKFLYFSSPMKEALGSFKDLQRVFWLGGPFTFVISSAIFFFSFLSVFS